jgi:hypothetical protein
MKHGSSVVVVVVVVVEVVVLEVVVIVVVGDGDGGDVHGMGVEVASRRCLIRASPWFLMKFGYVDPVSGGWIPISTIHLSCGVTSCLHSHSRHNLS